MVTDDSCKKIDTTILVLHPSSAPHVVNAGGALEFEEEGALVLPVQKQLKEALVRALSDFACARKSAGVIIESRLRVEPDTGTEFPATHVIRLVGSDVTAADVTEFRAAAQLILSTLVPQRMLGDTESEPPLSASEMETLRLLAEDVVAKFANRAIKQGVMIRFGGAELHGVTVHGVMPALTLEQRAMGTLHSTAKPMGFDEQKGHAILWVMPVTGSEEIAQIQGRIEVLCHDPELLRILAKAYANRSAVEFRALRQREARKQKMVMTLLELKELPSDRLDAFELQ